MGVTGVSGAGDEGAHWVSSDDWRGRSVTVMGLGLFGGGLGAARFALSRGAEVTVTDQRDGELLRRPVEELGQLISDGTLRFVLGRHEECDFQAADLVIVNPAVPKSARLLEVARDAGTEITTAIELLLGRLRCRVVAVTGTHGKSSTAHFAAELLGRSLPAGTRVALGGNIGGSLLEEADGLDEDDVVVLELSSYQLEHLSDRFLSHAEARGVLEVAAITNIGVDHLARHKTVAAYRAAKLRLVRLAGPEGLVVLPASERSKGVKASSNVVFHGLAGDAGEPDLTVSATGEISFEERPLGRGDELRVPGEFQRSNLSIALLMARHLGGSSEALLGATRELRGLPHRMESLGEFVLPACGALPRGTTVHVMDNGVSTTPESTIAALESLGHARGARRRLVLVGGKSKPGSDLEALGTAAQRYGWTLVPFGAAASAISEAAQSTGADCILARGEVWSADASEAARAALEAISKAADDDPRADLLFSPACASFDRYPNFQARAAAFRSALSALVGPPPAVQEGGRGSERRESQD